MTLSSIEWLNQHKNGRIIPGYTFNPWWGCEDAPGSGDDITSPACANCYARAWAKRCGDDVWGEAAPRKLFGESHWKEPIKWQREAAAAKEQRLVFCGSMMDIGEDRRDLDEPRRRVFELVDRTPNLTWLFLTKRPKEFRRFVPSEKWPRNAGFGVTVESAAYLWRIEEAFKSDAPLHFVSYEPALGPVDFRPYLGSKRGSVRWLIYGVENSPYARAADHSLGEAVVEQCSERRAAAFIKQLDAGLLKLGRRGKPIKDPASFPASLRVREWPDFGGGS